MSSDSEDDYWYRKSCEPAERVRPPTPYYIFRLDLIDEIEMNEKINQCETGKQSKYHPSY